MRLFSIIDRFEEKIRLFKIQEPVVELFKMYDDCIGCITINNELGGFRCAYLILPWELEPSQPIDVGFITFNNIVMLNGMSETFEPEWIIGIDYLNVNEFLKYNRGFQPLEQPSISKIKEDLENLYKTIKLELE